MSLEHMTSEWIPSNHRPDFLALNRVFRPFWRHLIGPKPDTHVAKLSMTNCLFKATTNWVEMLLDDGD
jgi:hypothetical protein